MHRWIVGLVLAGLMTSSPAAANFYDQFASLDDMRAFLAKEAPLGTSRSALRSIFVNEGGAALHIHPERPSVEKYVYDINLCSLYVWRWNVSANYDAAGNLTQVFLNGEPVHPAGDPKRDSKAAKRAGTKQAIAKMWRSRPEARLGESKLAYILYDLDVATKFVDDEFIIGGGPSRADPASFGNMHVYTDVERWRSIFDEEAAKGIVNFSGVCPGA